MNERSANDLLEAMRKETLLFEAYLSGQKDLETAISERDWIALQSALAELGGAADMIERSEKHRGAIYESLKQSLGLGEDDSFYQVALSFQEPLRSELGDTYRKLKLSAIRARIETTALNDTVEASRSTLGSILEELFPDRKTRVYGKSGKRVDSPDYPLVLDAAL